MGEYYKMPSFFGQNEFANGWFHQNEGDWYRFICERMKGGNIVEIGSFEGLSLSHIKDTIKSRGNKIWSIEKYCREKLVKNTTEWGVNLICSDSTQASLTFPDKFFDFIFIDADHKYQSVKDDILNWLPKLKENGLMGGHDYCSYWVGVKEAVDEVFLQKKLIKSCWLVKKKYVKNKIFL